MLRRAPVLFLLVAACAPPDALPPPSAAPAPPRVVTIPLVTDIGGKKFPVPLVRVRVAGLDTLFIVDTGSTHTVVTAEFAAQSGIVAEVAGQAGRGHANEEVTARVIPSLSIGVGPVERTLTDALAIQGPPVLAQLGIGGFLSPQTFFDQPVILDLPRHAIVLPGPERAAALTWLAGAHGGEPTQSVPTVAGPEPRKLFVEAALDDRRPALCEVDTGGSGTEFLASYVGNVGGPAVSGSISISGTDVAGTKLADRSVVMGGMRVAHVDVLARDRMDGMQGLLGMTVLGHFAILLPGKGAPSLVVVRADD